MVSHRNWADSQQGKGWLYDNLPNSPDIYDGKVYYTIRLDGEALHLVVNTDPRSFENVKLFAGDTFYAPADANYKGLTWEELGHTLIDIIARPESSIYHL